MHPNTKQMRTFFYQVVTNVTRGGWVWGEGVVTAHVHCIQIVFTIDPGIESRIDKLDSQIDPPTLELTFELITLALPNN